MSPPDIDGFNQIKEALLGKKYNDMSLLKSDIRGIINELNQSGKFTSVKRLPEIWKSVVNKNGDY